MAKSRRNIKVAYKDTSPNGYSLKKTPILYQYGPLVAVRVAGENSMISIYEDHGDGDYVLRPGKYFFSVDAAKAWMEGQE